MFFLRKEHLEYYMLVRYVKPLKNSSQSISKDKENGSPPSLTGNIHQTHLKVFADLLHHLQLSFVSWKLKDRVLPLITTANVTALLVMAVSMYSAGTLRSYQFYFQRPDWSKRYTRTDTLSNTQTNTLTDMCTFFWTKAYRSHHIAHAKNRYLIWAIMYFDTNQILDQYDGS